MFENDTLDQEVLDAYVPKGHSVVARHPSFPDIIDRLLSGWSPRQVEHWLVAHGREPFLTSTKIYDYAKENIPAALLTQDSYLRRRFAFQTVEINEMSVLQMVTAAQLTRVSRLMEEEQKRLDQGQPSPYNPYISREMKVLIEATKASAALKLELGMARRVSDENADRMRDGVEKFSEEADYSALPQEPLDPHATERLLRLAARLEELDGIQEAVAANPRKMLPSAALKPRVEEDAG